MGCGVHRPGTGPCSQCTGTRGLCPGGRVLGAPKGSGVPTEALVLREAARQREGPKLQSLETLIQSVLLERLQAEGWRFI